MEIPLGNTIQKLLKMRKDSRSWDPHSQMPWGHKTIITDENGKKFKVEVTLNPKEAPGNANI